MIADLNPFNINEKVNQYRTRTLFTDVDRENIAKVKKQIVTILEENNLWVALQKGHCMISGGLFTSLLHNEEYNDIDIYIKDTFQAKRYFKRIYGISSGVMNPYNDGRIQYIFTNTENLASIPPQFDYYHCMVSFYNENLYISPLTYDCAMYKYLVRNTDDTREENETRKQKFLNRGFTIKKFEKGYLV